MSHNIWVLLLFVCLFIVGLFYCIALPGLELHTLTQLASDLRSSTCLCLQNTGIKVLSRCPQPLVDFKSSFYKDVTLLYVAPGEENRQLEDCHRRPIGSLTSTRISASIHPLQRVNCDGHFQDSIVEERVLFSGVRGSHCPRASPFCFRVEFFQAVPASALNFKL